MDFSEFGLIRGQCGLDWMAQTTDSDYREDFSRTSIAFSSDLLQRLIMGRGCEHDQAEKIDEDMELNLGLSLGRGYHGNEAKKEKEVPCGDPDMKKKNSENCAEQIGLQRDSDGCFNFGLEMKNQAVMMEEDMLHNQNQDMLEHQKKRELHALRRQKARKKREEKQLQRAKKEGVVKSSIHHTNKLRNGFVHVPSSYVPLPTRGTVFGAREEDKRVLETQMSSHREKERAAKESQNHQNQNQPRSDKKDKVCDHGGISCIEDKSSRTSNEIKVMVSSSNGVEPPTSNEISSTSHPSFPILPMPYPFPLLPGSQPMPLPMGFPFPYMMPYWGPPTARETSTKGGGVIPQMPPSVLQPVATRPFPLFQIPVSGTPPSWVADSQAPPMTGPMQSSHASGASSGRSSSAISDYESRSSQGTSSNDTKSQSSTSSASKPLNRVSSLSNMQEQTVGSSELSASSQLEPPKSTEAALEKAPSVTAQSALATSTTTATHEIQLTEASSFTKSSQQVSASNATTDQTGNPNISEDKRPPIQSSLPKMPCVSTTGPGPNGKTISGFLYSYSRDEVSIVCVCHGTFLSPAEFVQHSGRTDLSHPERHIVVNPSPSSNEDASALE